MDLPAPFDLLPHLVEGLRITLRLTVGGAVLAAACALAAGLGKLSPLTPWRWLCVGYVELFRGTSALVQLFWFFFALPRLGVELSATTCAILVLGLNGGAYGAEIVRGAVMAVPRAQQEAARALGFSSRQIRWRIIVPQALPAMLPPAGNLMIELLKNTALCSMITLGDLTFQAQVLRSSTLRTAEIFGLVFLFYFAAAQAIAFGVRRLERTLAARNGS